MKNRLGFKLLAFVIAGALSSMLVSAAGPIAPKEAILLVDSGRAILVDVREKDEIADGMLAGAVWLPTSAVESGDESAQKTIASLDRSKQILVYCRSGRRAAKVGALLESRGFEVRNLGGFADARDAGMKVTKPGPK